MTAAPARPGSDGGGLAGPPGDDLIADHVRTLYEQTPITLAGNAIGVLMIGTMYGSVAPPTVLWGWVSGVCVLILLRILFYLRFPRDAAAPLAELVSWRRRWNAVALLSSAGWGLAVWVFYGLGSTFHFVGLILIVYSYMLAGVQLLATQPRVYFAFVCLGMLPMAGRIALDQGDSYHLQLAAIMLLLLLLTVGMSVVYRRAFESTIRLKVQTEHLAEQLRREKADAEAARREAEVANRSKTQFFAAASHDLRQPLHALGLFAEALRQRSHEEGVAHLVNSINSSVDALEGLFSELLDITKIDSGGVEPRPEHFSIGDLFARLRLHFEPTAFEKGLALRFRGGLHFAHADPVLVDRILRNLVANAIRYTQDGSVLVGCRRRGDTLRLQVWDTGVGIHPRDQEHIFEEFFQVPGAAAPEPHQRKGLGLGLAIVQRLARLQSAPLVLQSQPGRGTVFTLTLPVGRAVRSAVSASASKPPLGLTLERRLIVVVEDEPAVRASLDVLLQAWGATVQVFDTAEGCQAWAAALPPGSPRADLLILDYRLEQARTGIDALLALRRRFGADVPAIMMTGSTMTGHEVEAQRHDFHVLIKPVVPNKLRAMIAFKLGVR